MVHGLIGLMAPPGDVIPFSTYDNGGDLVETAFMVQGLLTLKAIF